MSRPLVQQLEAICERLRRVCTRSGASGAPDALEPGTLEQLALALEDLQGAAAVLRRQTEATADPQQPAEATRYNYETYYRTVFDNCLDAVLLTIPDGRVLAANPAACRLFGHSEAEICRLGRAGLVDPTDSRLAGLLAERERTGRAQGVLTFVRGDGTSFPGEVSSSVFRDRTGSPRTTIIIRDLTELAQAEAAIRQSEAEFRMLAENLPDIVARFDRQLRILYVSRRIKNVTGIPEDVCQGRTTRELGLPPDLVEQWEAALRDVFETGQVSTLEFSFPGPRGPQSFEARLIPERGADATADGVLAITRDVTDRKRIEAALTLRTQQLEAVRAISEEIARELNLASLLRLIHRRVGEIMGAFGGGIWLWDDRAEALICRVSAREEEWERGKSQGLGEGLIGLVAARRQGMKVNDYRTWPNALPSVLRRSAITAALAEPLLYHERLVGVIGIDNGATGRTFSEQDAELLHLFAPQAAIAIVNAQLFEEVQTNHTRIENLSRQQFAVQEHQRRALARELHDEIGQQLTGLGLTLEMVGVPESTMSQARLGEARELVRELLTQVRMLSLDLRPAILDDMGLLPALLWHFDRYTVRTRVQVRFTHTGLESRPCPPAVETAAYRIVQEALTNVARHARTSAVEVRVWVKEKRLLVSVEDQGQGFDPEAVLAGGSAGLAGMQERARLLGGCLTVNAAIGGGTQLLAELPLDHGVPR